MNFPEVHKSLPTLKKALLCNCISNRHMAIYKKGDMILSSYLDVSESPILLLDYPTNKLQPVLRIRIRDPVLFDPWIRDPRSRILYSG